MNQQIKERIDQIRRGEVPEGYKKRNGRILPNDWENIKMKSVIHSAGMKNKNNLPLESFSVTNSNGFVPQEEQFEDGNYKKADKSMYVIVSPKSFAYNPARINVGSIGYQDLGKDVIVSSLYEVFQTTAKCDDRFLWYWFHTSYFDNMVKRFAEGGVRQYFYLDKLNMVDIQLPPLAEQKKIAEILAAQDKVIALKEKLLEEKKKQKKYLMQQLLTGKKRLPGFSGEWKKTHLSKVTSITAGATPNTKTKEYWGGDILWMSSGELNNKRIYDVDGRITYLGYEASSTKIVPENCILIGLAGQGKTRGTAAINYVKLCTNQSIAAIHPCKEFFPEYLYQNLDMRYLELRKLSSGDGTRGGLNLEIIGQLMVLKPTLEEQEAIANVLYNADKEISAIQKSINQEKHKKKALMQLLLTGIVRVTV